MLLRALVESPELRLRVLTGHDGLERPVDGVFTTDLLDPSRYLTGGEIVLTGLMWRRSPQDSRVFVSALAAAGVAALAAGDAVLGSVPPDLVEACRDHRLPLLEVPVDVSFAAITEQVMLARLGHRRPGAALTRLRQLADAAAAGNRDPVDALRTLFAFADAEYAVAGWVLSATGRLVAGTRSPPGAQVRAVLAGACLSEPGLPATVMAGDAPFSLFRAASSPPAHHLAGWYAVFAGDHADWDSQRRAVAAELAGLAAGYRARNDDRQRPRRRAAGKLLSQLRAEQAGRAGPWDAEIAAAAQECGLHPHDHLAAVAATVGPVRGEAAGTRREAADSRQAARVLLEDMLPGSAAGVCGDQAVALAHGGSEVTASVAAVAAGLGRIPGLDLAFGVSVPAPATGGWLPAGPRGGHSAAGAAGPAAGWAAALRCAVAQACQAARLAALLPPGVRMVDSAEVGSYDLLLAMVPAQAREAFHDRLLGPLLAYDRDHGTELVATLAAFLRCSGSWTMAAGKMFVHVNSLRYRIHRIEKLTGRSLRSLGDQAAFLLALRLAGSAAENQPADPPGGSGVQAMQFPAG